MISGTCRVRVNQRRIQLTLKPIIVPIAVRKLKHFCSRQNLLWCGERVACLSSWGSLCWRGWRRGSCLQRYQWDNTQRPPEERTSLEMRSECQGYVHEQFPWQISRREVLEWQPWLPSRAAWFPWGQESLAWISCLFWWHSSLQRVCLCLCQSQSSQQSQNSCRGCAWRSEVALQMLSCLWLLRVGEELLVSALKAATWRCRMCLSFLRSSLRQHPQ